LIIIPIPHKELLTFISMLFRRIVVSGEVPTFYTGFPAGQSEVEDEDEDEANLRI